MYVYIYIYIYTVYIHKYTWMYTLILLLSLLPLLSLLSLLSLLHINIYIYIYIYIYTFIYIYTHINIYMFYGIFAEPLQAAGQDGYNHPMAPKGEKLAWFWCLVRMQTVKTWPTDPLGLRNVQLEVDRMESQRFALHGFPDFWHIGLCRVVDNWRHVPVWLQKTCFTATVTICACICYMTAQPHVL